MSTAAVLLYAIGAIGALMQIAGGYWDVSWHLLGLVETFFTPPHTILYSGVVLVLFPSLLGVFLRFGLLGSRPRGNGLLTGLHIALVGSGLQIVAGGFDFWWHSNFGFDPFLFTPSHTLLILGIILGGAGMAVGTVRLLQFYRVGLSASPSLGRLLSALVLVSLASLWLDLNAFVYLVTDVSGMAYTFQLSRSFVTATVIPALSLGVILLSLTGTLTFLAAKRIFRWRGAVTLIALIGVVISATANLGFRALVLAGKDGGPAISAFLPLYLGFLVPVVLFDLLLKNVTSRIRVTVGAILLSPFASYLDGWNSVALWTDFPALILVLLTPMLLAGLFSGVSNLRFARMLLSREIPEAARPA